MDWQTRMNQALNYIEEKLTDENLIETAAKMVGWSVWEFQRFFSFVTHTSLGEYIRGRKLALAAIDIQKNNERIIDIALKYGYDSHAAFSRAFGRQYGISPSAVRNAGVVVKPYPRITFQIINEEISDSANDRNDMQSTSERTEYCKRLTSPCGLDCFNCMVYESNITQMSEEWVKGYSERMNIPIEDMPCKGCREEKGCCKHVHNQQQCATWNCVQEKGVDFCSECKDFPCSLLMPSKQGAGYPHNMKIFNFCRIKQIGFDKWVEESMSNRFRYFDGNFYVGQGPVLKEKP